MNDTETRLRDYLHSQAATVPDTAQGPGLERSTRRRHWPVLATAAAIAVVLVVTVTFLTRLAPDSSVPVPAGPPPGPVSNAAPEVPYTVLTGEKVTDLHATLHDGDRTVSIPRGVSGFFGRVDGGWLAMSGPRGDHAAILKPDGTLRTLGPDHIELPALSPNRSQIAVIHRLEDTKGELVVVDVKSGKEVSRSPQLPVMPSQLGWAKDGIWYRVDEVGAPNKPTAYSLHFWKPKSDHVMDVAFPNYDGGLAAPPTSDVVALTTRKGNNRCLKAGVLRDGAFDEAREYCDVAAAATYPVLSPDGRTMVSSDVKLAIDVQTGKQTKLRLPANTRVTEWPEPVFENVSQLLLVTEPDANNRLPVQEQVFRCDVRSGECAAVLKTVRTTLHRP
ncbi:hypothetical protein [Kribbella sp. NPDC048928]|uniref:hypothetical protein n=1 Tax=Kribbella sp. NPDC048928 TaxID=3364111 RepID=UPI003719E5B7